MSSRGTGGLGAIYAEALAEAADAVGTLEAVGLEVRVFADEWRREKDVRAFFLSGAVRRDAKSAAIDRVFRGKASDLFADFLHILLRRNRLFTLPDVDVAFTTILDAKLGRVPVRLTTATPASPADLAAWSARVAAAIGKTPVLTHHVKPAILGGAIIRVGDTIADASVRRHLVEMRARIATAGRAATTTL